MRRFTLALLPLLAAAGAWPGPSSAAPAAPGFQEPEEALVELQEALGKEARRAAQTDRDAGKVRTRQRGGDAADRVPAPRRQRQGTRSAAREDRTVHRQGQAAAQLQGGGEATAEGPRRGGETRRPMRRARGRVRRRAGGSALATRPAHRRRLRHRARGTRRPRGRRRGLAQRTRAPPAPVPPGVLGRGRDGQAEAVPARDARGHRRTGARGGEGRGHRPGLRRGAPGRRDSARRHGAPPAGHPARRGALELAGQRRTGAAGRRVLDRRPAVRFRVDPLRGDRPRARLGQGRGVGGGADADRLVDDPLPPRRRVRGLVRLQHQGVDRLDARQDRPQPARRPDLARRLGRADQGRVRPGPLLAGDRPDHLHRPRRPGRGGARGPL